MATVGSSSVTVACKIKLHEGVKGQAQERGAVHVLTDHGKVISVELMASGVLAPEFLARAGLVGPALVAFRVSACLGVYLPLLGVIQGLQYCGADELTMRLSLALNHLIKASTDSTRQASGNSGGPSAIRRE